MLAMGDKAPAFELPNQAGDRVSLASLLGQRVVLYFYPKDNTPGCTKESQGFNALFDDFTAENTVILGVSKDNVAKHQSFAEKFDFRFDLLADVETTLCQAYGAWQQKSMFGKAYMGIQRCTYLIDEQGRIAAVWPKVKVTGHAEAVLAEVQKLPRVKTTR